jgi:hypothetical protein
MSRRLLAVALTILMIAAVALVVAPAGRGIAASPTAGSASVHADARPSAITYDLANGLGYSTFGYYYLGEPGWETLTFSVTDPSDHDVNVTITDPNASRDGVSNPAFTFEAPLNSTTHSYDSAQHGVSYTFPNLAYGGSWLVNFSAPIAGYVNQTLSLEKYYVSLSASVSYPDSILPGESFTVYWWAQDESNGVTPYTGATSVQLNGHYHTHGKLTNLTSPGIVNLTVGASGSWTGTVPLNATADSNIDLNVWVVTKVGSEVAENESASITIHVGVLVVYDTGLSTQLPGCPGGQGNQLANGSLAAACLTAASEWNSYDTPAVGLPVTVHYWNGLENVTPAGAPSTATTNSEGAAVVLFSVTSPPFRSALQYPYFDSNSVNLSVSVPGANSTDGVWTYWENLSFEVSPYTSQTGVVLVTLGQTQYFAGATASASWSISSSDASITGPLTPVAWYVTNYNQQNTLFDYGAIGGTAQTGSFTFPVTAAMVGFEVEATVVVANATLTFDGFASMNVVSPTLLVTATSGNYFAAGTTVDATVGFSGGAAAPSGSTISWQAVGYWNDDQTIATLASGTATSGAVSFKVPASNPPETINVDAWATTAGQVVATGGTQLELETGYSVQLGVVTISNYADGSFQPGQSVTLSYSVSPIDGTAMPQVFEFLLYLPGYPYTQEIQSTSASGTVGFTVPSNAKAGSLQVDLEMSDAGLTAGYCLPTGGCTGSTTLAINPSPSVLSMELGAGSGLTVGWLILLVLLIVVALVLYLVLRRRGGSSGMTSAGAANPATPMSPPAPAPSTPPANEWQPSSPPTPSPSDSSPPPLPPPSGSS